MLSDNIKRIRKEKGLTQEDLASSLNVVRQTVSKWEKGLSVPDADILERLAEKLDTNVVELFGGEEVSGDNKNEIARQLARINEELSIKNRRAKKIWKIIGFVCLAFVIIIFLLSVLNIPTFESLNTRTTTIIEK